MKIYNLRLLPSIISIVRSWRSVGRLVRGSSLKGGKVSGLSLGDLGGVDDTAVLSERSWRAPVRSGCLTVVVAFCATTAVVVVVACVVGARVVVFGALLVVVSVFVRSLRSVVGTGSCLAKGGKVGCFGLSYFGCIQNATL